MILFVLSLLLVDLSYGSPTELPNDTGCFHRFRGVCTEKQEKCLQENKRVTWKGCSDGFYCCYDDTSATTAAMKHTIPAPQQGACGISYVNRMSSFRITGGRKSVKSKWPWIVSLNYAKTHICGASLILDDWVLTAAHCFDHDNNKDNFEVVLGEHFLNETEVEEQRFTVTKLIIHSEYNKSNNYVNDIALLKLDKPVTFTKNVQRICLPDKKEIFGGQLCTLAGWGYITLNDTKVQQTLKEVNLPIYKYSYCKENYGDHIVETQLCAGYEGGMKDACRGDSGGPLMCKPPGTDLWKVAGIVSWGIGCGLLPGVYTRVSSYLDWIKSNAV